VDKIVPCIWYDKEAREAAALYAEAFWEPRGAGGYGFEGAPNGGTDIVPLRLRGGDFVLMSAGPFSKPNPSISFFAPFARAEDLDRAWAALAEGGSEMMPLGAYPFSERYGWIVDRYGLSWQLMLSPGGDGPIAPTLMFAGANAGKAEEALAFYLSLFGDSRARLLSRYGEGAAPNAPGHLDHAEFDLEGRAFCAMDSSLDHGFGFNEAVSFMVRCADQAEIDRRWAALSAVPEAERCGWLKDRFGVSWQIVPAALDAMMSGSDDEGRGRIVRAFLGMGKFDIVALEAAARG
jgi:predicted 3-demethylubiquinone-9 3-methyltransferase (glyoxalase superfamily)